MRALGYLPLILQAVLLGMLLRNRAFKVLPCFFFYTVFSVAATALRFVVRNHEQTYFYVYWISDALYALLGVAVLYEVLSGVLKNLMRFGWLRIAFLVAVLLTMALTFSRTQTPVDGADALMAWTLAAELGLRYLQVAMFAFLVLMVALFGLRWRQQYFGISAGYGIYATVNLFTTTKYYEFGTKFTFLWSVVSVVSYTIAVLIWLWYFSTPIAAETPRSAGPPLSLEDLERYKQIVRKTPRP
jgi:hypothetical protein